MESQIDNVHSCSLMTPSKMGGGSTEIRRFYYITDFNWGLTPKYYQIQIKSQLGSARSYYWPLTVSIRVGLGSVYMPMGMGGCYSWVAPQFILPSKFYRGSHGINNTPATAIILVAKDYTRDDDIFYLDCILLVKNHNTA